VSTLEPFQELRNQGMILARSYQKASGSYVEEINVIEKNGRYYDRSSGEELRSQVEKMSKSKLNGVTPDDVIEEYGADSLRLYEMFMGPLEKEKIWNTDAVSGCRRFLSRVYDLAVSGKLTDTDSVEALKLGHRLVHGVCKDVEAKQFNTAIAKMMEFMNDFTKLPAYPRSVVKMVAQVLMPFAPHMAEEVWELLQGQGELSHAPYPIIDQALLEDDTITYVVQVNGKLRGRFELPKDQPEAVVLKAALEQPAVAKYVEGLEVQKIVFVPNKLLNIVVKN
jgi:leucyl-tRNA synthetase